MPDGGRWCIPHRSDNRVLRAGREREAVRRASGPAGLGLKRLYDSAAWRVRMRRYILGRDPLCRIAVLCLGRELSTDLDHIVRAEIHIALHGGDVEWFFDEENVRGACHADHSRKTALENRGLWNAAEEKKAAAAVAAAELV